MGGSDSKPADVPKPKPQTAKPAPKKSSSSNYTVESGNGYSGKKWGDTRSAAEKARDEHNKPAGVKKKEAPSWQKKEKIHVPPSPISSRSNSTLVKEVKMEKALDKDIHKVKKKFAYQNNTPAVSSHAQAKPAAAHMAKENDRRKQIASSSSSVAGNADWVKGAKNAQERADMVAAQEWMEAVTGERFTNGDLWETTKSGVYLCELINKIKPGSVKRFKNSKMPFTCMENITKYIEACKKLGMREGNTFRPPDLYEKRVSYPRAIINNIHGLARIAEDTRGFNGPNLEVEKIAGSKSW